MPRSAMAFTHDIQYGPNAIFTYGPLGFLEFPQLYFTSTFILAELYVIAIHLVFFAVVYWSLSRSLGRGWGIVLAVVGTWGIAAALLATPQGVAPASPGSDLRWRSRPDLVLRDDSRRSQQALDQRHALPFGRRHGVLLSRRDEHVLVDWCALGDRSTSGKGSKAGSLVGVRLQHRDRISALLGHRRPIGREHLELRLRVGAGFFRVHRGNVCRERPKLAVPRGFRRSLSWSHS